MRRLSAGEFAALLAHLRDWAGPGTQVLPDEVGHASEEADEEGQHRLDVLRPPVIVATYEDATL